MNEKLVVLWTSGDKEVALKMAFMYTCNSKKKGWWDDVTLLIWGRSANLTAKDSEIQEYIKKMIDQGVSIEACKACANMYVVSPTL